MPRVNLTEEYKARFPKGSLAMLCSEAVLVVSWHDDGWVSVWSKFERRSPGEYRPNFGANGYRLVRGCVLSELTLDHPLHPEHNTELYDAH